MFFKCFVILLSVCLNKATGQFTTEYLNVTLADDVKTTEKTNGVEVIQSNVTQISCMNGQWQCQNGDCIPNHKLCNGLIDCSDASDEYRHTCKSSRPLFALILHCSSLWSDYHSEVCHEVCQDSPMFCYYALMAENGDTEEPLCILPKYPEHGWYKLRPDNSTTDPDAPKDFWLDYDCAEPYVMVQKQRHECINGTWFNDDDNRTCSDACELHKNSNFTYTCPKDINNSNECKNYVAINTNVTVARVPQTGEDGTTNPDKNAVSLDIFCSPDKKFHLSTECVTDVDKRQEEFENPTMTKMTDYETEFNKFRVNETSPEFEKLVTEFHQFDNKVRKELQDMHVMAEKCDISLDLYLWDLQIKRDEKNAEKDELSLI